MASSANGRLTASDCFGEEASQAPYSPMGGAVTEPAKKASPVKLKPIADEPTYKAYKASIPFFSIRVVEPDQQELEQMKTAFLALGKHLLDDLQKHNPLKKTEGKHKDQTPPPTHDITEIHAILGEMLIKEPAGNYANVASMKKEVARELLFHASRTDNRFGLTCLVDALHLFKRFRFIEKEYLQALHIAGEDCTVYLLSKNWVTFTKDSFISAIQKERTDYLKSINKQNANLFQITDLNLRDFIDSKRSRDKCSPLFAAFILGNQTALEWMLTNHSEIKAHIDASYRYSGNSIAACALFYDVNTVHLTQAHILFLQQLVTKKAIGNFNPETKWNLVMALYLLQKTDLCGQIMHYWEDKSWHQTMLNALFNGYICFPQPDKTNDAFIQWLREMGADMNPRNLFFQNDGYGAAPAFPHKNAGLQKCAVDMAREHYVAQLTQGQQARLVAQTAAQAQPAAADATASAGRNSIFYTPEQPAPATGGGAGAAEAAERKVDLR